MRKERENPGSVDIVSNITEAIKLKIELYNKHADENDDWPLIGLHKLFFIISSLKSKELKKIIHINSSVNWGKHILTSIFPKNVNPEEYHSRHGVVCLTENPIQVLGWKEKDEMVQQGVDMGLDKDWINYGFYDKSEERGIDLEWSFFETPRQYKQEQPNNHKQLHNPNLSV